MYCRIFCLQLRPGVNGFGTRSSEAKKTKRRQQNPAAKFKICANQLDSPPPTPPPTPTPLGREEGVSKMARVPEGENFLQMLARCGTDLKV